MDAARWNRIEELLQEALDREPHERAAFLTAACGSDAGLRREIDDLLAREASENFLSRSPAAWVRPPPREDRTGQTISHYRLTRKIGAGGMGEVYEAHDENLQRTVALKVLPQEFTSDPDRVRRFEQEAFSASRLNHPNIITIFEILHTGDAHFIATELIDGRNLRDVLKESRHPERSEGPQSSKRSFASLRMTGPLDAEKALDVAIQVAEALKAAHTAWIIHRDIKPENIMVRADGLVKVLDFGIAKTREEAFAEGPREVTTAAASNLTAAGAILGTAKYMSPEQARGEPLDGRTDLYSLGLVLTEMLTGVRDGKLDAVPKEVQRIVRRLLRANRDERYPNASELLDDLRSVRRRRESRNARRMVGIGVLAVIVAIAVAAVAAMLSINETWEEHVLRDGHTAAARSAVFSPDGTKVVSCGEDGQVIVWDFARRERIAELPGPAYKVAWSPNGRWIAVGGTNGVVTIQDAERRVRLRDLRMTTQAEISALGFSQDSTLLASGNVDGLVIWETARWTKANAWPHGTVHTSVIFTADLRYLIATNNIIVHDRVTGRSTEPLYEGANWIAASPDSNQLVGIEPNGEVAFFRFEAKKGERHLERVARIRAHQDHGRGAAWSPDGRLIATAADDIILWDPVTRLKVARFEYPSIVWSITFSPDGRWLLSSHGDGSILVWDVAERRCAASFNGHSGGVRAVAISNDGQRVASGSEDQSVILWNLATGRKERVLTGIHDTRVTGVAFTRDDRRLASVDQDGHLVIWDLATRAARKVITDAPPMSNYCVTFSPDDRFITTTRAVVTFDGRTVQGLGGLPGLGQIYGADYAPDGRWLATAATAGGNLTVWDGRTYQLRERRQLGERFHLITVSVSPDGKWIVTGEDEGAVRLWATSPLRQIAILGRHGARVKSVAFAPDGKTVASAGDDGMIALWDVRRRKLIERIGTHASPVYAIAFSPDGTRLVSGEHDRSVRVYTRRRTLWGMRLE